MSGQTSWSTDWWMKPFGADSPEREWIAETGGVPRKKARPKKYGAGSNFFRSVRREIKRVPCPLDALGREAGCHPTLRVKLYAHDRFSMSIYDSFNPGRKGRKAADSVRDIIAGRGSLVKRRETRRGFKVGGRTRFRPPYTRFTTHARNWVRDAAHIIEISNDGTGVFITLTMAGGTRKAYACMAAASGYIVDRMNRWLRYRVQGGLFTYVWELQERGAPHMHYLCRLPNAIDVDTFGRDLQSHWRKILLDVSAESGVDVFARLDGGSWKDEPSYPRSECKKLTHTYAQYISKYCSKERTKGGLSSPFRPGRWSGVSYAARKEVLKHRLSVVIPIRKLEHGLKLADTLIKDGAHLLLGVKWASLREGATTRSLSISVRRGLGRRIIAGLIRFIAGGDVSAWGEHLQALWCAQNTS